MDIPLQHELTSIPRSESAVASFADRLPRILDHVVWWGLLLLLPLMAVVRGADEIWWQTAFECYAFGLGALWVVAGLSAGDWKFTGASLFIPLVLLAAYALLQTIPMLPSPTAEFARPVRRPITYDILGTYRFAAEMLALTIIGKLTIDYIQEKKRLLLLIYVVLAAGAITAAVGVFRFIVQISWPTRTVFGYATGEGFAQFANRNYFCLLLEMVFGLGLGFLLAGGIRREHRMVCVAALILLMCTIILTTSRGGTLAAFTQVSLLGAWAIAQRFSMRRRHSTRWRALQNPFTRILLGGVLISAFVCVVGIAVVQIGGDPLAQRTEQLSVQLGRSDDSEHGQRGDIWRATLQLIKDKPFTGVGFGAYYTAIPLYHRSSGISTPSSALNDYLNLLAAGGLIAAVLALSLAIVLIARIRRGFKAVSQTVRASTFGVLGGFIGVGVHSFFDAGLQVPINAVMLVMLLAIAARNVAQASAPQLNALA